MNSAVYILGQTFSLQYQNCGYGPEGIVVLPEGDYFVTNVDQTNYLGPIWVSVMQNTWQEPLKIRLYDFLKFQEYKRYL
ncbi:MAG: hypothetical protein AB9846_08360 [Tenuifilaceae bacterium]